MAEQYIDVSKAQKTIFLNPEELHEIKYNSAGLTKEGVQRKIAQWAKSNNKQLQGKYVMMFKRCKNYAKPGKLKDGRTILSREVIRNPDDEDDIKFGNAKWAEWVRKSKLIIPWIDSSKPFDTLEAYQSQESYDAASVEEKI